MRGPLATSLRGLWVSGLLPPYSGGPSQGRRPENRPGGDDLGPRAGIPKRKLPNCQKQISTLVSAFGCINTLRREGTREPRRRGATGSAGCRDNRRYVTFGRSHTSTFSSPSRANSIKFYDTAQERSCVRLHPVFRKLLSLGRRCLAHAQQGLLRQVPR